MRIIVTIKDVAVLDAYEGHYVEDIATDFISDPEFFVDSEDSIIEVEREQPKPPPLQNGVFVQGVK